MFWFQYHDDKFTGELYQFPEAEPPEVKLLEAFQAKYLTIILLDAHIYGAEGLDTGYIMPKGSIIHSLDFL